MATAIESNSTARALYLLAKQLDDEDAPDFFLVIMDNEGRSSTYKDASDTYNLIGAVEVSKLDLIYVD